jgi:heterotetrameric sarcosine oxidase gamma subunit
VAGWEVSKPRRGAGVRGAAALTLTDLTPVAKTQILAPPGGAMEQAVGVSFGHAARDDSGALVVGSGPGEWLVLGPVGQGSAQLRRLEELAAGPAASEFVTVLDLTHGGAVLRLSGPGSAAALASVCGIDLSDRRTPRGTAFRSLLAGLVTDVIRDDQESARGPLPSYLLRCERSYGQYLFDTLLDACTGLHVEVDGFSPPGI